KWFRSRTENARGTRKPMIVALARKLLIALWRLMREGIVPDGVVLGPAQCTKDAEGTTTVSACPYACDGTPMTVRGGGIPRRPLALTPNGRMGPPLRSFAADAHDCIMVRVLGPTGYKVVARLNRAPKAGSPLIVIATALSVPSCSKPSRYGLARGKHAARLVRRPILTASARIDLSDARVGMKKRTLRSNQETDEGKRCAALANSLTKKAPYKGLGAESEEKHEPVSDIDTGVVDSLKALDPERPIREADVHLRSCYVAFVPISDIRTIVTAASGRAGAALVAT